LLPSPNLGILYIYFANVPSPILFGKGTWPPPNNIQILFNILSRYGEISKKEKEKGRQAFHEGKLRFNEVISKKGRQVFL